MLKHVCIAVLFQRFCTFHELVISPLCAEKAVQPTAVVHSPKDIALVLHTTINAHLPAQPCIIPHTALWLDTEIFSVQSTSKTLCIIWLPDHKWIALWYSDRVLVHQVIELGGYSPEVEVSKTATHTILPNLLKCWGDWGHICAWC